MQMLILDCGRLNKFLNYAVLKNRIGYTTWYTSSVDLLVGMQLELDAFVCPISGLGWILPQQRESSRLAMNEQFSFTTPVLT